jgi:hypothetical protein
MKYNIEQKRQRLGKPFDFVNMSRILFQCQLTR